MKSFEYFLNQLSCFSEVDILCFSNHQFWDYWEYVNDNPIRENEKFRKSLQSAADQQEEPVLKIDSHEVVFGCIRKKTEENTAYFMIGPMALKRKSKVELHAYYKDYGMKKKIEKSLPVLDFTKILGLIGLAAGILTEKKYTHEQLIQANHLNTDLEQISEEKVKFSMASEGIPHHTYEEERRVWNAVREGQTKEAMDFSMALDGKIGIMSKTELFQWKKTATVTIALCTRAAIEGGISPIEAYQISDFYNQKCDECKNVSELLSCRNLAIHDLTDLVRRKKEESKKAGYVELCCDYIAKHYCETIRLEYIAKNLGISSGYLSRIFSRETGMRMQDYIIKERVEHAANMLKFSDLPISEIGNYVNFPSQSYFGKMFKKYKNMTPAKYRNLYRPKEFIEKKQ